MYNYKVKFSAEKVVPNLDGDKITELIKFAHESHDIDFTSDPEEGYLCFLLVAEERKDVNMFLVTDGIYLLKLMQEYEYELEDYYDDVL